MTPINAIIKKGQILAPVSPFLILSRKSKRLVNYSLVLFN